MEDDKKLISLTSEVKVQARFGKFREARIS